MHDTENVPLYKKPNDGTDERIDAPDAFGENAFRAVRKSILRIKFGGRSRKM